eukprot:SAG11_NODE_681_length_7772_cov_26.403362_5_plen_109_part_00
MTSPTISNSVSVEKFVGSPKRCTYQSAPQTVGRPSKGGRRRSVKRASAAVPNQPSSSVASASAGSANQPTCRCAQVQKQTNGHHQAEVRVSEGRGVVLYKQLNATAQR